MTTHLYRFFDSITENDTFHIQSDWFYPTKLDLDDTSTEQDSNVVYCHITVTNLLDYFTCTITRDLLLLSFKDNEIGFKEQKNDILEAAFQGEPSYKDNRLQWDVTKDTKSSQLKMQLQIFKDDLPLTVGSFILIKVPQEQVPDLKRLWFEHLDLSSCIDIEINKTLKQHITDIEKTNREYRKQIESINNIERKKPHVAIDKFLRLVNTKKKKIYELEKQKPKKDTRKGSNDIFPITEQSKRKRIVKKRSNANCKEENTENETTNHRTCKGKMPIRHEYDEQNETEVELDQDFTVPGSSKRHVRKK